MEQLQKYLSKPISMYVLQYTISNHRYIDDCDLGNIVKNYRDDDDSFVVRLIRSNRIDLIKKFRRINMTYHTLNKIADHQYNIFVYLLHRYAFRSKSSRRDYGGIAVLRDLVTHGKPDKFIHAYIARIGRIVITGYRGTDTTEVSDIVRKLLDRQIYFIKPLFDVAGIRNGVYDVSMSLLSYRGGVIAVSLDKVAENLAIDVSRIVMELIGGLTTISYMPNHIECCYVVHRLHRYVRALPDNLKQELRQVRDGLPSQHYMRQALTQSL